MNRVSTYSQDVQFNNQQTLQQLANNTHIVTQFQPTAGYRKYYTVYSKCYAVYHLSVCLTVITTYLA